MAAMPSSATSSHSSHSSQAAPQHAAYLKKLGSIKFADKLQHLSGMLEVKFKGGAFSTWSDVFVRLEGRWMVMYKRERDSTRLAAIELGPGVEVTDITDLESSQKFPRRFDVHCKGGVLPATEFIFRTKSRKDRDLWVHSVATNIHVLDSIGLDPWFAVQDLEHVITRMKEALTLQPIRIRSQLAVRCATGEDIVAFLVAEELARDRSHANQIGRRLLSMNVLHHVVWEKDFVDSPDHFTLADFDDESNYVVEHFQKYMDSRRFWKYFDEDGGNGSSHLARSTASSAGSGSLSMRASSATNMSQETKVAPVTAPPPPPSSQPDKKAKKCSVCSKSFNPLRRRYYCRFCTAVICSHCSVSRKSADGGGHGDDGNHNARICVSCKLSAGSNSQDDFYDRIFSTPSVTASTSDHSNGRASSFSQVSTSGASSQHDKRSASSSNLQQGSSQRRKSSSSSARRDSMNGTGIGSLADCHLCMGEACSPLQDPFEVPYPVSQDHITQGDRDTYLVALELEDEAARLRSVRILVRALETTNLNKTISQMCSMASIATTCPTVVAGLLDSDEYMICGQYGVTSEAVVAREKSLAAHTCRYGAPIVCSDLASDVRFAGNPWRRDVLQASFYAGIPLQLANGHIVGAIEVFDVNVRFACMDVLTQMQTIVKGVLRKFEEIVANAPPEEEYQEPTAPVIDQENGFDPMAQYEVEEVSSTETKETSNGESGATSEVAEGQMSQNDMEMKLMELLSQTTTTQEQLRNQQGQMFTAINTHSKQISELAKQLERMESTLASKLDGPKEP